MDVSDRRYVSTPRSARKPSARCACCTPPHALPRPATPTRLHHRQPEGRRRQDHHGRQRRGRARAAGPEGSRDRPRPAGQRQHRPRRRSPPGHPVVLRGAHRRDPAAATRSQRSPHSERLYCVPATIDLAGAEIELVSMVAREGPAAHRARRHSTQPRLRLRLHRLPAVAGPADHQRARRRARRC